MIHARAGLVKSTRSVMADNWGLESASFVFLAKVVDIDYLVAAFDLRARPQAQLPPPVGRH